MSKLTEAYQLFKEAIKEHRKESNRGAFDLLNGPAPLIDPEKLKKSRIVSNRENIIEALDKDLIIAEIGTLHGDFANRIFEICSPKKLYCLDLNFKRFKFDLHDQRIDNEQIKLISGKSWVTLAKFPDNYFDVIYIDADHTYSAVRKDLNIAKDKIKNGGIIICNDFTNWAVGAMEAYGVYKATCEFINEHNVEVEYLSLQPYGYYDLSFRYFK